MYSWILGLLVVLFLLPMLRLFFREYLPESVVKILNNIDELLTDIMFKIPGFLSGFWHFSATLLYFVGNLTVLLLLAFGAFILFYSVRIHAVDAQLTAQWVYGLAQRLVDDKVAWSGATIVVGATVAIAHMWKLKLDRIQYEEQLVREYREKLSGGK